MTLPVFSKTQKKQRFNTFIDTFISEKNIDIFQLLEVEGQSGLNLIPIKSVVSEMKRTNEMEQKEIYNILVELDFINADIVDYFKHLAQALAI
jgi:hypothetical protein